MGDLTPIAFKLNRNAPESFMYIKQHKVRGIDEKKPGDRTLFVLNVPPCAEEDSLKHFFSCCGSVENVFLHRKPTVGTSAPQSSSFKFFNVPDTWSGFKVAYVVFNKASSIQKALRLNTNKSLLLFGEEQNVPVLMRSFCKKHCSQILDPEELKKEIQDFMEEYDKRVELEKQQAKEMDGVPDEEGWITVSKHGKNPVTPRTESASQKLREKKRRSEKALLNFYSFQMKESKMEHLAKLRKGFEEDKQRMAIMRASRRFRPC